MTKLVHFRPEIARPGLVNFDKHCPVTDWTLHDLRRTFRTMHAKIGTPPHIAERLVNHVGATSTVEKIYDRYTYMPEMKLAIKKYDAHLAALFMKPAQQRPSHREAA
ncbi:MAG: hypothetical protein ACHP82_02495 [Hyphomicrobiales bacterium]